jgi:PAS domain S-box-containing protein
MWVLRGVVVAVAYLVAGKLALLMAIPPGYATAVWPAAGIALVAVLRWGPRVLPGVFVGSVAANLSTSLAIAELGRALAIAGGIAAGATLQAFVASALLARFVPNHARLERARDVFWFVLIGGPVSCVIASTIGTGILAATGTVSPSSFVFSWFTWWVGDTIGAVMFAPLVLALVGPREVWGVRRVAIVAPLAIGFALITVLFVRASQWEVDQDRASLAHRTSVIAHALDQQLAHYTEVTSSLASFVESNPEMTHETFRAFAAGVLARDATIRGIGYQRGDELFLEPDMTLPFEALREGRAGVAISKPLDLDGEPGFSLVTRVPGGLVACVVTAAPFVARAAGDTNGIAIAITDTTGGTRTVLVGAPSPNAAYASIVAREHTWEIAVSTFGSPPRRWQAWLVLAGGLAFVAGLGTLLLVVTGRTAELVEAQSRSHEVDGDHRFLLELGDKVTGSSSVAAVMRRASNMLAAHLGIVRCWFAELDGDAHGEAERLGLSEVLAGKRVVLDERGLVATPIIRGSVCIAYFAAEARAPRAWTNREITLVQTTGERTWQWVEHLEGVADLKTLSKQLEVNVAVRTHELALSEANFRTLIERAPSGVMVHLHDRIVYVNPALIAALGHTSMIDVVGRSPDQLLHEESRAAAKSLRESDGDVLRVVRADGSSLLMRTTAIPIEFDNEPAVLAWMRDVTAEDAAERAIREALREKESLLKEIHHRVKNNLQIVSSLINLQARTLAEPTLRAAFDETQQRIQSIALVHERLYQSKDLARISLDEYFGSLVENLLYAHDAAARGISSKISAAVEVPVSVAIPCGLIVNELATNSLKYAFPKHHGGTIRVTLEERAGEVELVVADDGVGLPPNIDPRKATSLGLDLVFTFAEQLGATVAIGGSPGTSFSFKFRANA